MKKIIIITVILNYTLLTIYSQPSLTWSKTYGAPFTPDISLALSNSGSGFYYVGGINSRGNIMKIDDYGDTVWCKPISETLIRTIVSTPDKGCIVSGDSDSLRITRLDSNGVILWSRVFGTELLVQIRDIKRTSEGNYIACGYKNYPPEYGVALKFDSNGILLWSKQYHGFNRKLFLSIDEITNENYILTGIIQDFDTAKALLLKLDDSGYISWEKQFKVFNQPAYGGYVKKISSGFFIYGLTLDTLTTSNFRWMCLLRTDTSGNLVFAKLFTYYKNDDFMAAQFINENRYIVSSFSYLQSGSDTSYTKVIIIDSLGNILVSRNFYADYYLGFNAIVKANNSDIILSGSAKIPGSNEDVLVCRVDSLLEGPPIGLKTVTSRIPQHFIFYQNYPNPFNSTTTIKFDLPQKSYVNLSLFDVLGKEITNILNGRFERGVYEIVLDMNDKSTGVYFIRLQCGDNIILTKKILLIK